MHAVVIRIDTTNYGYVVSRHRTAEAAQAKIDRLARWLPQNAIPIMWTVADALPASAAVGSRVRIAEVAS